MSKVKEAELVDEPEPEPEEKNNKPIRHQYSPVGESQEIAPRGDADMLMMEAVRSGNIDIMERVMAIRRELKAEAAREAFFTAMADFQKECPVIKRTKVVKTNNFSYRYAPLDQIVKQVGPIIAKHGLSYTIKADIEQVDGAARLIARTYVHHEAGHSEFSEFSVPIDSASSARNKQQDMGNANTYAKRYSFCNAFGLMTEDEDNDAHGITPNEARQARPPVNQPKETPTAQKAAQKGKAPQQPDNRPRLLEADEAHKAITEAQGKGLSDAMHHAKLTGKQFTERFGLSRLGEIRFEDVKTVLKWIADPEKN